jgi:Trypsin-like peptidase domain/Effector-associated domain 1
MASDHFLDVQPFDLSLPGAYEFTRFMSDAYPTQQKATILLAKTGIPAPDIEWKGGMRDVWYNIMLTAASAGKSRRLAEIALGDPAIAGYHSRLRGLIGDKPVEEAAPVETVHPVWEGDELVTGDQPTFVDVCFFAEGLRVASSVVLLSTVNRSGKTFYGSGLLIAKDLVLTNHHVLYDQKDDNSPSTQVEIRFNYEKKLSGKMKKSDYYAGDVSTIKGDREHDWAVIRIKEALRAEYPILSLEPSMPARQGDYVFIVQHPNGGPKQLGWADDGLVHYLTDTSPGSSGSPVFNREWQVVALHHRGIKADPAKGITARKNEGIAIGRVVEGLKAKGITL